MPRSTAKAGTSAAPNAKSTRSLSTRTAKSKANASLMDHDGEIDALIRKHDKKGARGFAKNRKAEKEVAEPFGKSDALPSTPQKTLKRPTRTTKSTYKDKGDAQGKKETTRKKGAKTIAAEDPSAFVTPKKSGGVLGESTRKNNRALEAEVKDNKADAKLSPFKERGPVSPSKRRATKKPKQMSEVQIQSFLENYDLEAENRIRIAHKTLQISIDSARTQMHAKAIAKLPRSVRLMRLQEFIQDHGADVQVAMEHAAVTANRAREGEWEEEKLQRKRKGEVEDRIGKDKNPRKDSHHSHTGNSGDLKRRGKGKGGPTSFEKPREKATLDSSVSVGVSSSYQSNAQHPRPPSAATFTPRLDQTTTVAGRSNGIPRLPPTPAGGKPRAARVGEQVQWSSLNGSPIVGIIGPDGMIHAMPKAVSSPSRPKSKNWQPLEEDEDEYEDEQDAAETSAHLLELAKGIDSHRVYPGSGNTKGRARATGSPASQASMHTAQASRRATLDTESDDGDVFEEARSLPLSDAGHGDDSSLPDEEEYTAQVLREEAAKRARMGQARSSASSRAPRSSGDVQATSRSSYSTIRPTSRKANALSGSSSPMVKSKAMNSSHRMRSSSSTATSTSSSPSKGRVSIIFDSGSQQRITHLGVEDLMRLPSHERAQMLSILEKLKRAQLSADAS